MNSSPVTTSLIFRVPVMMVVLAGLVVLMIFGVLLAAAEFQNRQASSSAKRMVETAVRSMAQRLDAANSDHAMRERTFLAATRHDLDWLMHDFSPLLSAGHIEFVELHWPQSGQSVSWGAQTAPAPGTLPATTREKILAMARGAGDRHPQTTTAVIRRGSGYALISAHTVQAPTRPASIPRAALPVSILGVALSQTALSELAAGLPVAQMKISRAPTDPATSTDPANALALAGLDGTPVVQIEWTPDLPGRAFIRSAVVPVSLLLLLFLVLCVCVAIASRRSAASLAVAAKEAHQAARTDTLTGLPNRLNFRETLDHLLADRSRALHLLYLDINGFKQVNDTMGHAQGDVLVRKLAGRLRDCLPEGAFLARIGGDEFTAIFTGPQAEADITRFSDRLQIALARPFDLLTRPFHLAVAMGYSHADSPTITAEEVVRRADVAMYAAKQTAPMRALKYNAGLEPDRAEDLRIECAMREALNTGGEFSVLFQPLRDARTGKFTRAEALVRWHSARLGEIGPKVFIPVAEQSGLMRLLALWVITEVARKLAARPDLRVNINISPFQVIDDSFVEEMSRILAGFDIAPARIEIELTEGVIVPNAPAMARALRDLKARGHTIALDDFGTGFSSLGYLRQVDFDTLKIDRSLVTQGTRAPRERDILEATIKMARALDLEIVAEGVETATQAHVLAAMGVDLLQGYFCGEATAFEGLPPAGAAMAPAALVAARAPAPRVRTEA
ncbi:MAG: bifunctional diguanylate cyclase/phosphodiesterase [Paracoccaceae bacterium]